jgi:hypothetical protein
LDIPAVREVNLVQNVNGGQIAGNRAAEGWNILIGE